MGRPAASDEKARSRRPQKELSGAVRQAFEEPPVPEVLGPEVLGLLCPEVLGEAAAGAAGAAAGVLVLSAGFAPGLASGVPLVDSLDEEALEAAGFADE